MRFSASERNARIYDLLEELIRVGKTKKELVYSTPFEKEEVEKLFISHIWGHREILLTIILARLIDPRFKASKDFYECNPRSIYEGPIRELLREHGIPHKKSGPLNVAKNSKKIDDTWAHNKRGDGMALNVSKLVKKIESVSEKALYDFAVAYVQRYLLEGKRVAKLTFKIKTTEDPMFLYELCKDLVTDTPDGGATPQFIIGALIDNFNKGNHSPIKTTGYSDSVSTTNTTSKKPGDVMEEFSDSTKRIYEITVKPFTADRMIESYESIKEFDKEGKITEVFVICRKEDVPLEVEKIISSSNLLGTAKYQDVIYYFIDIFGYVREKLVSMTIEARGRFYTDLGDYVNQLNTSEKVKRYFSEWHQSHSS